MTWPFRGCARIAVVRRYGALPASLLAVALCALSLPAFATPRAADGAPAGPGIQALPEGEYHRGGTAHLRGPPGHPRPRRARGEAQAAFAGAAQARLAQPDLA